MLTSMFVLRILARVACVAALLLLPAACAHVTQPRAPASSADSVFSFEGAQAYRVVAAESQLRIIARRGGALAAAGHNHVIASRNLLGDFAVRQPLERSSFSVRVPVALLTVDEPGLRAGRGADFPQDVPESARESTRRNLLGESLLDAQRYPGMTLESRAIRRMPDGSYVATVAVTLKGVVTQIEVPSQVTLADRRLRATGRTTVEQSRLGLVPFSVLLGALNVQDELEIEFDLVARR